MDKTENRFQKEQTLLAQAHETINAVCNARLSRDEDNPCYDYTTDNLDCQDLTILLARLVNTRLTA